MRKKHPKGRGLKEDPKTLESGAEFAVGARLAWRLCSRRSTFGTCSADFVPRLVCAVCLRALFYAGLMSAPRCVLVCDLICALSHLLCYDLRCVF